MTGVQTLVPIMLDHVNAGRMSLERFVDMTSAGPTALFGIARKGRIAVGYDADLTIVDLKRRETITNDWIASKAGWTPYDGVAVTGWPVGTIVRGSDGDVAGRTDRQPPQASPMRFLETLAAVLTRYCSDRSRLYSPPRMRSGKVRRPVGRGTSSPWRVDQRRERREQRGMRQRQALDAFVLGGVPGLGQILERELTRLALLVECAAELGIIGLCRIDGDFITQPASTRGGTCTRGLMSPQA